MRYLYIKLNEACNAGCFFCGYAYSKDQYRLSESEFEFLINNAMKEGLEWVRFTGGEPLLHKKLPLFISKLKDKSIKSSIITNGIILEKKIDSLVEAGINEVIISIDDVEPYHDENRKSKNLFEKSIRNIEKLKSLGIRVRVNTILSKESMYRIFQLRDILEKVKIDAWEVNPLKTLGSIPFTVDEEKKYLDTVEKLYDKSSNLVPIGKMWLENELDIRNFFDKNIVPIPKKKCKVVRDILFYDGVNKKIYPCPCLSHKQLEWEMKFEDYTELDFNSTKINNMKEYYEKKGFIKCKGCSTTNLYYNKGDEFY